MTESTEWNIIEDMRYLVISVLLLSTIFMGCGTKTPSQIPEEPVIETPVVVEPVVEPVVVVPVAPKPQVELVFDPSKISQEVINTTRDEVRTYIDELTKIIQSRNYEKWRTHLSDEYFTFIYSPETLKLHNERLKGTGVVLKTARDYFMTIVVPSRGSRINIESIDIYFVSPSRVTVTAIVTSNTNRPSNRQIIYELERTGNTWKVMK